MTPRQDFLLNYLASGHEALDPIRIMKGMFVFGQEAPAEWLNGAKLYEFKPYNWGPFSQDIYTDLDDLVRRGFVEAVQRPGDCWKQHRATPTGRVLAEEVAKRYDSRLLDFLKEVRDYAVRQTFENLLRAVYKKYPQYAVNSVFRY